MIQFHQTIPINLEQNFLHLTQSLQLHHHHQPIYKHIYFPKLNFQIHTTICRATGTGVIGCDTGPRASNHVYSALSVEIIVQHAESLISTRNLSFGHGLPLRIYSYKKNSS